MTAANHEHVADAVIAALESASLLVGDADSPAGAGWQGVPGQSSFVPYVVVWPMDDAEIAGTGESAEVDHEHLVMLRSIGANRTQAARYAQRARAAVLADSALIVTGRTVLAVRSDLVGSVIDLDEERPVIYQAAERFRIFTTGGT